MMANKFRRILINMGKAMPFILVFIVMVSYIETLYAITSQNIVMDYCDTMVYDVPISDLIGNVVYCDWFDVLLLFILSTALECCYRNHLAVALLGLNLIVRAVLENTILESGTLICVCGTMAVLCALSVISGLLMLKNKS